MPQYCTSKYTQAAHALKKSLRPLSQADCRHGITAKASHFKDFAMITFMKNSIRKAVQVGLLVLVSFSALANPPADVLKEARKAGSLEHLVVDTGLVPAERGLPGPAVVWLTLEGRHVAIFETDAPAVYPFEKPKYTNVYAYSEGDKTPTLVRNDARIACFVPPGLLVLKPSHWQKQYAILLRRESQGWTWQETREDNAALKAACSQGTAQFATGPRNAPLRLTAKPRKADGRYDLLVEDSTEQYLINDYSELILSIRRTARASHFVISENGERAGIIDIENNSVEVLPNPLGKLALPMNSNLYSFPAPDFKSLYIAPGFWRAPFGVYLWDGESPTAEKLIKLHRHYDSGAWVSVAPDHCFAMFSSIRRLFFPPPPTVNFVNLCSK